MKTGQDFDFAAIAGTYARAKIDAELILFFCAAASQMTVEIKALKEEIALLGVGQDPGSKNPEKAFLKKEL